jgi:choice-of-anchor B domain-containing protein
MVYFSLPFPCILPLHAIRRSSMRYVYQGVGLLLLGLCCFTGPVHAQTPGKITGQRIACANGVAASFPCGNVDLMAYLPIADVGGQLGGQVNDLWGWTDPETGKEYALVGRVDGTGFVDVTNPVNPVYVGQLLTHTSPSLWRDIKVYDNHAFVVADGAGAHGMQVFDLTQLRAVTTPPVTFVETAHYGGIASAHNLAIDEDTGFAYVVGANGGGSTCGGGLHMVDIRNPLAPTFAGCFSDDGYTHDAQCVHYHGPDVQYQGREICVASNTDTITIVDVTDKGHPVQVSRTGYPNVSYTHQGWLTDDHSHFLLDDEGDEFAFPEVIKATRTLIWDLEDLDDPQLLLQYFGEARSIDHNQYVAGQYAFQANYTSGLRILDLSDIEHPREVAFFDTVPSSDALGFDGAWSVYPFFASGVLVINSISQGLFVVDPTSIQVATEAEEAPAQFVLSPAHPNPFNPQTTLTLTLAQAQAVRVAVYDVLGREVAVLLEATLAAGVHPLTFEAAGLPSGAYLVRATGTTTLQTRIVTLAR